MAAFVMSPAQFERLRAASGRRFVERVIRLLRRHCSHQARSSSDEALRADVERQVAIARTMGLAAETDLASFVVFRFLLGTDPGRWSAFDEIWRDAGADGPEKVTRTRALLLASEAGHAG